MSKNCVLMPFSRSRGSVFSFLMPSGYHDVAVKEAVLHCTPENTFSEIGPRPYLDIIIPCTYRYLNEHKIANCNYMQCGVVVSSLTFFLSTYCNLLINRRKATTINMFVH